MDFFNKGELEFFKSIAGTPYQANDEGYILIGANKFFKYGFGKFGEITADDIIKFAK